MCIVMSQAPDLRPLEPGPEEAELEAQREEPTRDQGATARWQSRCRQQPGSSTAQAKWRKGLEEPDRERL